MTLNCKAGDLAIVVKSFTGNEGKIVRCIRLADDADKASFGCLLSKPVWVIDKKIM